MSVESSLRAVTVLASADLSASQFCFMDIDTNGNLVLPSSGAAAVGVLQDKPNALGQAGELAVDGISKVVAGAAFADGAHLMSDGSGNAILATTGHFVLGRALAAAGAQGVLVPVLLVGPYGI